MQVCTFSIILAFNYIFSFSSFIFVFSFFNCIFSRSEYQNWPKYWNIPLQGQTGTRDRNIIDNYGLYFLVKANTFCVAWQICSDTVVIQCDEYQYFKTGKYASLKTYCNPVALLCLDSNHSILLVRFFLLGWAACPSKLIWWRPKLCMINFAQWLKGNGFLSLQGNISINTLFCHIFFHPRTVL